MMYITIGIVAIILLYVLTTYNSLVKANNYVKEAFSTMDIYLKKRWDLIPNLVEVVKTYATYEKNVFTEITNLRTKIYQELDIKKKISVNEGITNNLKTIIGVAEKYPDLKANENFMKLSKDLTQIEDEIANSRKYYNGCVRIFNNKIQMFPNNLIANIFKFEEASMFEANIEEKNNVKVDL